MFILNRLVFWVFILITCIFINISNAEYVVKTVYFIPTDSIDKSDELDLDNMMKSVQSTYRDEMQRHGFGNKTFELETDDSGKVVVHKVKGDHNKAHYASNTAPILIPEMERKGYDDIHTTYNVIMAGMNSVQNGAGGTAISKPWGAWFGNGNSQYSGYSISTEVGRDRTERIITHELGHIFGLWHLFSDHSIMGYSGWGNKLDFHEARWLSRNHYFNKIWHHSFGPNTIDFGGAKLFEFDKISFSSTISDRDNDGIFQVYAWIDSRTTTVGWNFFDGTKNIVDVVIDSIDRNILPKTGHITFQGMDIHGNWMIDFPQSYVLPDMPNKNEDLAVDDIQVEDCPGCKVDANEIDNTPRSVSYKFKLATSWGVIKSR